MVAAAVDRRRGQRSVGATLDHQPAPRLLHADPESPQHLGHAGQAIALFDPKLRGVRDDRGPAGSRRERAQDGDLVDRAGRPAPPRGSRRAAPRSPRARRRWARRARSAPGRARPAPPTVSVHRRSRRASGSRQRRARRSRCPGSTRRPRAGTRPRTGRPAPSAKTPAESLRTRGRRARRPTRPARSARRARRASARCGHGRRPAPGRSCCRRPTAPTARGRSFTWALAIGDSNASALSTLGAGQGDRSRAAP
jgi:hypothetical protein